MMLRLLVFSFVCISMSAGFTLLTRDEPPITIELYYESFCPGCRAFVTGMLFTAFEKLKDTGIMKVMIYPYGNAHQKQKPDGSWDFECQHGSQVCWQLVRGVHNGSHELGLPNVSPGHRLHGGCRQPSDRRQRMPLRPLQSPLLRCQGLRLGCRRQCVDARDRQQDGESRPGSQVRSLDCG